MQLCTLREIDQDRPTTHMLWWMAVNIVLLGVIFLLGHLLGSRLVIPGGLLLIVSANVIFYVYRRQTRWAILCDGSQVYIRFLGEPFLLNTSKDARCIPRIICTDPSEIEQMSFRRIEVLPPTGTSLHRRSLLVVTFSAGAMNTLIESLRMFRKDRWSRRRIDDWLVSIDRAGNLLVGYPPRLQSSIESCSSHLSGTFAIPIGNVESETIDLRGFATMQEHEQSEYVARLMEVGLNSLCAMVLVTQKKLKMAEVNEYMNRSVGDRW